MSSGSLFGTIVNIVLLSAVWSVVYKMFSILIHIANGGSPSMDLLNLLTQLDLIFIAGPILIVITLAANHVINAQNEMNMGV